MIYSFLLHVETLSTHFKYIQGVKSEGYYISITESVLGDGPQNLPSIKKGFKTVVQEFRLLQEHQHYRNLKVLQDEQSSQINMYTTKYFKNAFSSEVKVKITMKKITSVTISLGSIVHYSNIIHDVLICKKNVFNIFNVVPEAFELKYILTHLKKVEYHERVN